jgi:hypothetical protein
LRINLGWTRREETWVCNNGLFLKGQGTVLLGVTMGGEKLPLYIIFKGANTPRSLIQKEFKDVEARTKYGYH